MTPYSMRCNRCGEFIYKGKKFNARKEEAIGEEYYGIKVYRFYIKCEYSLTSNINLSDLLTYLTRYTLFIRNYVQN